MNLVYDRTAEDVERALALAKKAEAGTLTDVEKTEWLAGMKGCYNATDMNRVSTAVQTLAVELNAAEYTVETIPQSFAETDIIRLLQWRQYLANVQSLRDAYYTLAETGQLPGAENRLDYIGANTVEKVLADIDLLIGWMKSSYRRCGTFQAGNNAAHMPLKGSA